MEQLNPGTAAHLALNTLSSQINALINITTGAVQSQMQSLASMLASNIDMIVEASNNQVDEIEKSYQLLDKRFLEMSVLKDQLAETQSTLDSVRRTRDEEATKSQSLMATADQLQMQRDNYKRVADEAGALKAENKRLKNQVDRTKTANEKLEARVTQAEQATHSLRTKLLPIHDAVTGCVNLMRTTRNALLFEGLSPEETLHIKDRTFYLYRRPGNIKQACTGNDVDDISRDHMYYIRVETHDGVHFDAIPLANGDISITGLVKSVPVELKKHIKALFAEETLFNYERIIMRSDALTRSLEDITNTMPPLEALKSGITSQLITNKVISASRVNANKQKRRAA